MNRPYIIRQGDRDSIPMGCGVKISYLRKVAGEYSILLQMEPNGQFPMHEHIGGEEIFVIDGDVKIGEHQLGRGDYFYSPPGFTQVASSETGCMLLISSARGLGAEKNVTHNPQTVK